MAKTQINIDPQSYAQNWGRGMTNAVGKMQEGVRRITENPMQKAADAVDRQVAGVQRAAQEGRTQAALRAVDFNEWKTKTAQKMGERVAGGVAAAQGKMQRFAAWLIPTINGGLPQINSMPAVTFEERKQKALAWMDYMHNNSYKGSM